MKIPKNKHVPRNVKIAHRGLWNSKAPENTIGAFKNAIKENIPIELDIHLLKDNTIVVFHDDNFKRMTDIDLKLKDATYEDIKNIKIKNTNYKIPTIDKVLKLIDGKVLVDIEIKCDRKSFKICKLISQNLDKYKGPFLVKSFNPFYIIWFRFHRPNYIRGLLARKIKSKNIVKKMSSNLHLNFLTKPDFIAYKYKDMPNKKIERIRNKGIPIYLWVTPEKLNCKCDGVIFERE